MSRELDRRDFTVNRLNPEREAELHRLAHETSRALPGDHTLRVARLDATTGNPATIASMAAPAEKGNYIQRALDHVRGIKRALGFAATQPAEFVADPQVQTAGSGAVAVYLQQTYKGIPVFQAAETVRFAPDGTLSETVGNAITVPREFTPAPKLTVTEAVLKAAQHVATPDEDEKDATDKFGQPLNPPSVDIAGFVPKILAAFPEKPDRLTVLEAGVFGDNIKASLTWFPLDDSLRLGWLIILTMPQYAGQFRTVVEAENGEVLYCRQLVRTIKAQGNVYRMDGRAQRQITEFPRPIGEHGVPLPGDLPQNFPDEWVDTDSAAGNCVYARLGANGPTLQGILEGGILTFNPGAPYGNDQKILNIFYFNCMMHDFFYLLGFREADGNFQKDNFGRGGFSSDRVEARAHSGVVYGTANMNTPIDGSSPVMNMGLVASTNRHTAFDASVVFHEFTHGVTNRLVGGPMNDTALEAPQSCGMGEGWSDYIPCTIHQTTIVGDWVANRPHGIRGYPYDSNFPDHFGKIGQGRYTEEHTIGEIWCATLLEMNRKIGVNLALHLVVDALKLSPANPSFLDMRDAILSALDNKLAAQQLTPAEHKAARRGIWEVMAKFGLGPQASSNGASLAGIVADFGLPPEDAGEVLRLAAAPDLAIPDNQPAGVNSTVAVNQSGRVVSLKVTVDIAHPYIGDLRVRLLTPGGATAMLHDRTGARTKNLAKTYSDQDTPALSGLVGQEAQGNWVLEVADLAKIDTGRLKKWRLELALEAGPQVVQGEATPAVKIPDDNPAGVSSVIAIGLEGKARKLKVSVDITHAWIGDLKVELTSPGGQHAILHDQSGGSQDNLVTTYESMPGSPLLTFINQPIFGNWVLRASDLQGQDEGKLNRWSLEITC